MALGNHLSLGVSAFRMDLNEMVSETLTVTIACFSDSPLCFLKAESLRGKLGHGSNNDLTFILSLVGS